MHLAQSVARRVVVPCLVAVVAVGAFGCGSGEDDPAEVQYLPLSGVLRRPQIVSEELVFRRACLRDMDRGLPGVLSRYLL